LFRIETLDLRAAGKSELTSSGLLHWPTHEAERSLDEAAGQLDVATPSIVMN